MMMRKNKDKRKNGRRTKYRNRYRNGHKNRRRRRRRRRGKSSSGQQKAEWNIIKLTVTYESSWSLSALTKTSKPFPVSINSIGALPSCHCKLDFELLLLSTVLLLSKTGLLSNFFSSEESFLAPPKLAALNISKLIDDCDKLKFNEFEFESDPGLSEWEGV